MQTEQSKNELITRFAYKVFSEIDNELEDDITIAEKNEISNIESEIYRIIDTVAKYFNVDKNYIIQQLDEVQNDEKHENFRAIAIYTCYKRFGNLKFVDEILNIFKINMLQFSHYIVRIYGLYFVNKDKRIKDIENIKRCLENE